MIRTLLAAAALALAACGGSTTLSSNPGQSSSCTVTLSGAVTGTFDCKPATTVWSSQNNTGGFTFNVQAAGTTPAVSVAIGFPGEPHTGTYASADSGAQGGVDVTTGSGASTQAWIANVGGGSTPMGSYSLVFSSVSNSLTVSTGKAYSAEGTLDATLASATGGGTTITVHATF